LISVRLATPIHPDRADCCSLPVTISSPIVISSAVRLLSVAQHAGNVAPGRLRNLTNPLGQKTLYTPDALDRITQLTDVRLPQRLTD